LAKPEVQQRGNKQQKDEGGLAPRVKKEADQQQPAVAGAQPGNKNKPSGRRAETEIKTRVN